MILLTGASGFVGRAALAALTRRGASLRLLTHRRPIDPVDGDAERIAGDLADPASLAGVCEGVDTLVHCASAIEGNEGDGKHGEDQERCTAVNVHGTAALVTEARRAGVRRIVHLSTAAVYGTGPHAGITENAVECAPASVTSRTRLLAERSVLAAGGTVVRPMFVYGPGDSRFVPALATALARTPVTVNGARARLSLVAVEDLAEAIAALAHTARPTRGVYHVNHPVPVTVAELHAALTRHLGVPAPAADLTYEDALAFTGAEPRLVRQLALVALDHFYDSTRVWRELGLVPGGFGERFTAYAPWYRRHLGLRQATGRAPVLDPETT
ncbi:NAD-dependent epimerase/dehydratase family protein [Streptomyces sp. RB6PN25]|uniref:NAD-dependent epimerase/dehydratase family protein n=1 Tax=Streptomyces humicola TaxID=2953240 RepID=A0ABT1PXB7_9ACTN|nr:NAD-dependent epimerase/dehydratase family protein [Streptomyces humicola]MCQ4081185.1 NAD-dependent epimerase/dehydratase family protein [Streptomyces humicola]